MKKQISIPDKMPRLKSLLHRLQQTPGPDEQPHLEQLMIFLDSPPAGVTDRWKEGAAMCTAWGIATTGASVWRLYRSYAIEWRARVALQSDDLAAETTDSLAQKAARLLALRTCELLANPDAAPLTLISLARIDLRQRNLDLARERHRDAQRDRTERALAELEERAKRDRYAQFALQQFKDALNHKPGEERPFKLPTFLPPPFPAFA